MIEFYGYERPDKKVGIRNHLLVLTPMDCSYEPAKKIAAQVEGAVAITQHNGCTNDPMVANVLIGTGKNPNVAGVLLIGLGCESITCEIIADGIRPTGKPVESLVIQEEGGTIKTTEKALRILQKMAQEIAELKREPFPLKELTLAVECGGSDATSGLAANPAVGVAADLLIEEGGTVIIGETQEMIGTEHILANRAINDDVAKDIFRAIGQQEARMKGMGIDSRYMSKGNVEGGLTTIEEKSLGAIRKGGTKEIQGVLRNNREAVDMPSQSGLWIQDGTGWDVPSITGMAAAGAQLVTFTSGKGSTTGHAIVPVLKITGNSSTYMNLIDNIDINTGTVLDGSESLNAAGEGIFNKIIEVASGKKTKAESLGYQDFLIHQTDRTAERLLGHYC